MKKAKTWSTITLAMIPICLAINYVGAQIAIALKLPMYLDVIGTVSVYFLPKTNHLPGQEQSCEPYSF